MTTVTTSSTANATSSSAVSLIGVGRMGAALARAFRQGGHSVTAWSRDLSKAQALAPVGVQAAASVAEAIATSDVIVVCIMGYDAWHTLLHTLPEGALRGKTVVQLSTGAADEALALAALHTQLGADGLDGSIDSYPSDIDAGKGSLRLAGDAQVFERVSGLLACLGTVKHVGTPIATAAALENASVFFTAAAFMGYFQGAAMFDKLGLPLQAWTATVCELMPARADWLQAMEAAMLAHEHRGSDATLATFQATWTQMVGQAQRLNLRSDFIESIEQLTREAIARGWGEQEFSAHYELLRLPSATGATHETR
jgi:3-hydroxyisobutyrate dehydrogenase-like beta-hydroxyacid dehydrogenase